jgi:hypothetical protein
MMVISSGILAADNDLNEHWLWVSLLTVLFSYIVGSWIMTSRLVNRDLSHCKQLNCIIGLGSSFFNVGLSVIILTGTVLAAPLIFYRSEIDIADAPKTDTSRSLFGVGVCA